MKLIATLGLLILTNIQIIFAQTANDWYKKGEIAYNARKYDEAIKSFDNAINQKCQFMDKAYYFRGLAKQSIGKFDLAITDLTQAISLNPKDMGYYFARANNYSIVTKFEECIADYNKVIENNGGMPTCILVEALPT